MSAAFNPSTAAQHPRNHALHSQAKEVADKLRPDLVRLHKCPTDKSGNEQLYAFTIKEMQGIKKQVTNHDMISAFHHAIHHLQKAVELVKGSALNEEVLWHLQEVMALLFKVQNLPV